MVVNFFWVVLVSCGYFCVVLGRSETLWNFYEWWEVVLDIFWIVVGHCKISLVVLGDFEYFLDESGSFWVFSE